MTPATQVVLPGARTSVFVPPGTSPTAAVAAARASQSFEKAPSAVTGKGGVGGGTSKAAGDDYEDLEAVEAEALAMEAGAEERQDGKYQDDNGKWHGPDGKFVSPPEGPAPKDGFAGVLVPKPDTSADRLMNFWRNAFIKDSHPDLPMGAIGKQSERDAYLRESERIAQTIQHGGQLRAPNGRFAKSVNVTHAGAVQFRNAMGQVMGEARNAYRAEKGKWSPNIREPEGRNEATFRRDIDDRIRRMGEVFFADQPGGLTDRRIMIIRQAFKLDREERGWPVPDWSRRAT